MFKRLVTMAAASVTLAACSSQDVNGPMAGTNDADQALFVGPGNAGVVYASSNAMAGNQVMRFERAADGTLNAAGVIATGGTGTGAGLGSQGAVTLSTNNRWLFVVNAGSNDVSVIRIGSSGWEVTDREPSGGTMPISVTVHRTTVYVLNAGGAGNISGFTLMPDGSLSPIAGSTRPLSGPAVQPAQVSFAPTGDWLVVTEKATNQILTYPVNGSGVAGAPVVHPSSGTTPFGFDFAGTNRLIVSEAFGGAPNASATSSYRLNSGGLQLVSGSVPTTETAACWVATTKNGRYAYVSNTGSSSVTGYSIAADGELTILDADGVTGTTAGPAIDAGISVNGQFLYVLNGNGTISAFSIAADGSLTSTGTTMGLPAGSVGLAAI
jgi:6-phosphogluconolactonase